MGKKKQQSGNIDITQTGPSSFRQLQELNDAEYMKRTGLGVPEETLKFRQSEPDLFDNGMDPAKNASQEISTPLADTSRPWGQSQYDKDFITSWDLDKLQDERANAQSVFSKLGNGIAKMAGVAVSTILGGAGVLYGVGTAINENRWSGIWDNSITQIAADMDKVMEDNFTNYKTIKQENAKWYDPSNLLSANFWADDVIKNIGYTIGAAASGSMFSGGLGLLGRATGLMTKLAETGGGIARWGKVITGILSSVFAGAGEGSIEARTNTSDWVNQAKLKFKDNIQQQFNAAYQEYQNEKGKEIVGGPEGNSYDPAYIKFKQTTDALQQKLQAGNQQIDEDGKKMGNRILLLNVPLLAMDDWFQMGKAFTKSFQNAAKISEATSKSLGHGFIKSQKANLGKAFEEATAKRAADESVGDVLNYTAKDVIPLRRTRAALKGVIREGSEEMNQQWIASGTGDYYDKDDPNDYWRAKLDPKSLKQTVSTWNAVGKGLSDSWGDLDQWEQFAVGGLTGLVGTYMPTKLFNQDKTKSKLNPFRYGDWEGGAYKDVKESNNAMNNAKMNAEALNSMVNSDEFWDKMSNMAPRAYFQSKQDDATDDNNKKAYKDANDKYFAHAIETFSRAGKIDDLRQLYSMFGNNLSDDEVDDIVSKSTTKVSKEDKKSSINDYNNQVNAIQKNLFDLQNAMTKLEDEGTPEANKILSQYRRQEEQLRGSLNDLEKNKPDYHDSDLENDSYVGPYVDNNGNRTKTNDEIREELADNSKELNRKIDSYLNSVKAVQQVTNGKLSNEQEDNLVYLHHISNEKINRVNKIISDLRTSLPTKITLNSSQDAQGAAQNFGVDVNRVSKEETGNKVTIDTTGMNDAEYARIYNTAVSNKNDAQQFHKDLLLKNSNKTPNEISGILENLIDVNKLTHEAGDFYNTLMDYTNHPEKINDAKESAQKDSKEKIVKNNIKEVKGMTPSELNSNSNIDLDELDRQASSLEGYDIEAGADSENKDDDVKQTRNNIKEAKKINDTATRVSNKLSGNTQAEEDAKTMLEHSRVMSDSKDDLLDLDSQAFNDYSPESPNEFSFLSQEEKQTIANNEREKYLHKTGNEGNNARPVTDDEEAKIAELQRKAVTKEEYKRYDNARAVLKDAKDQTDYEDIKEEDLPTNEDIENGIKEIKEEENKAKDPTNSPLPVNNISNTNNTNNNNNTTTQGIRTANNPVTVHSTDSDINDDRRTVSNVTNKINSDVLDSLNKVNYWKPATSEFLIGDTSIPFYMSPYCPESLKSYYETLYNFLNSHGVFNRINNSNSKGKDSIKLDQSIRFAISKTLTNSLNGKERVKNGNYVILMVDKDNNIIGDMADPNSKSFLENRFPGLKDLYNYAVPLFQNYKGNEDLFIVPNRESSVKQILIGTPNYSSNNDRNSLNDIYSETKSDGSKVKNAPNIGVAVTSGNNARIIAEGGRGRKAGASEMEQHIMPPLNAKAGQPYLLIKTASPGYQYITVPFTMPTYNHEDNYQITQKLNEHIDELSNFKSHNPDTERAWADGFADLLAVNDVYFEVVDSQNGPSLKLRIQQTKGGAWTTLINNANINSISNEVAASIKRILTLQNLPYQVSIKYVGNSDYNKMIGEIASTNIKTGNPHTVNDFFSINPISENGKETEADYIESKGNKTITPKVNTNTNTVTFTKASFDGKNYAMNNKTFTVYDSSNKELKFADNPTLFGRMYGIVTNAEANSTYNTPWGTFDSSTNSFKKNESNITESNENSSTPEEKNVIDNTISREDKLKSIFSRKGLNDRNKDILSNNLSESTLNSLYKLSNIQLKVIMNSLLISDDMSKDKEALNNYINEKIAKVSNPAKYREVNNSETLYKNRQELDKEVAKVKKLFPQLDDNSAITIVKGLIKIKNSDKDAYGKFADGLITVSELAARGTVYHEAFHYVFNTLMSEQERKEALTLAKDTYGDDKSLLELEENMAEDYRQYNQDEEGYTGKFVKLWRILKNFISKLSGNKMSLNKMFYNINHSGYSDRTNSNSYTDEMNTILKNARRDSEGNLLAPNGNKSNLNELQYAYVRTQAFKEWFGDWELIAYDKAELNSIPNLRKINVNSFLKAVDSRLEKDYLTTGYLNRESVEVIKKLFDLSKTELYQGDIKEYGISFYTGAIVLRTMTMEEAAPVFVHEVLHSYLTYAYDTDAAFRKEINRYHNIALSHNSGFHKDIYEFMANTLEPNHMAALLEIPSENNSSNLLKDIINSFVKHIRMFFKTYETKNKRTLFHDVIETIYNHKRNNSEFINNVSKVVDENGEPLVVYHESPNAFKEFDITKKRYNVHNAPGIWFSIVNRKGKGYGEFVYPSFLNIRTLGTSTLQNSDSILALRNRETRLLQNSNNDGIRIETIDKSGKEIQFAVKDKSQIKSAIDEDYIKYRKVTDDMNELRENYEYATSNPLKAIIRQHNTIKSFADTSDAMKYIKHVQIGTREHDMSNVLSPILLNNGRTGIGIISVADYNNSLIEMSHKKEFEDVYRLADSTPSQRAAIRNEMLSWNRLSPEQQEILYNGTEGDNKNSFTENSWNALSPEEKEYIKKCYL